MGNFIEQRSEEVTVEHPGKHSERHCCHSDITPDGPPNGAEDNVRESIWGDSKSLEEVEHIKLVCFIIEIRSNRGGVNDTYINAFALHLSSERSAKGCKESLRRGIHDTEGRGE